MTGLPADVVGAEAGLLRARAVTEGAEVVLAEPAMAAQIGRATCGRVIHSRHTPEAWIGRSSVPERDHRPLRRRRQHLQPVVDHQRRVLDLRPGDRRIPRERLARLHGFLRLRMRDPLARAVADRAALMMLQFLAGEAGRRVRRRRRRRRGARPSRRDASRRAGGRRRTPSRACAPRDPADRRPRRCARARRRGRRARRRARPSRRTSTPWRSGRDGGSGAAARPSRRA